jgi:hypothetical protein
MGALDSHLGKSRKVNISVEDLSKLPGLEKLADPMWRICSGEIYKIIVKNDDDPDDEGFVMPFKPNRAQRRFITRWWNRNIILKARQLGFTTLICILWTDFAMFNSNVSCGVIAQTDEAATKIFKSKVLFAYENLPEPIRAAIPLKEKNAHELVFAHNNSSIRVATSMRSGTIHRLLVSEFGKICAKFPAKADEVLTGSIPAVPLNCITVIESTAEGQEGAFYSMTQAAKNKAALKKKLTPRDYRFHFYPWYEDDGYRMDPSTVTITDADHEYFDKLEFESGTKLDMEQRAWYVATRNDFDESGKGEKMLQEYPSTPEEAFQRSIEGTYYAKQMLAMRKSGRILKIPIIQEPVYTFWDIGNGDGTAIWFMQIVGFEDRFIGYYEGHGEHLSHYYKHLLDSGFIFGKHFLPHDADHERLSNDQNKSIKTQLEDLGMRNIEIVPRISDLSAGIQLVRKHIPSAYIDEDRCAEGIKRMDGYKKKWNSSLGRFVDEPEKRDGNSEGADAFRQWAQAKELGMITLATKTSTMGSRPASDWRSR